MTSMSLRGQSSARPYPPIATSESPEVAVPAACCEELGEPAVDEIAVGAAPAPPGERLVGEQRTAFEAHVSGCYGPPGDVTALDRHP